MKKMPRVLCRFVFTTNILIHNDLVGRGTALEKPNVHCLKEHPKNAHQKHVRDGVPRLLLPAIMTTRVKGRLAPARNSKLRERIGVGHTRTAVRNNGIVGAMSRCSARERQRQSWAVNSLCLWLSIVRGLLEGGRYCTCTTKLSMSCRRLSSTIM